METMETSEYARNRPATLRPSKWAAGATAMVLSASLLLSACAAPGQPVADPAATSTPSTTDVEGIDDGEIMTDTDGIGDGEVVTDTEGIGDGDGITGTDDITGTDGITGTDDITDTDGITD